MPCSPFHILLHAISVGISLLIGLGTRKSRLIYEVKWLAT